MIFRCAVSWTCFIALLGGTMAQENLRSGSAGLLEIAAAQGVRPVSSGLDDGIFLYPFTREGKRRNSLVLTAGKVFETEVPLASALTCVSILAAMPFNLGDGAILRIWAGNLRVVELSLDPAHIRAHRAWIPVRFEIPVNLDRLHLRFEVDAGIRGDSVTDWLGLAEGSEPDCLFGA